MYSYEIEQLVRLRNYLLTVEEYFEILNTSPQIIRCTYNSFDDDFRIITEDNLDLKFKVKRKEG